NAANVMDVSEQPVTARPGGNERGSEAQESPGSRSLVRMDIATHTCGWRGHATFAPDEPELRARMRADTPAGEAWRCLRCESFVVGPPRAGGPADTAPEIPRGRLLRDRLIMRLLAAERVIRAIIFSLLAI